jgi:hypothetical protein
MAKDFIPKKDNDLALYLGNFQTQLATLGTGLGLTAAEVTAASTACTETFGKITNAITKKNESQQATEKKEISKKATITLFRSYARRIKAHPTYDAAKGQLLNIIGEDEAEQEKPTCRASVASLGVQIDFTKFQFDGVNVYRRRGNETVFTKMAFDKVSPYIDNESLAVAGQPEKRGPLCNRRDQRHRNRRNQ